MSTSPAGAQDLIRMDDGTELLRYTQGAIVVLPNGSDSDWTYGCTPTSAGMLMGQYDRNGYNGQSYSNLMPGGVAESTNHGVSAPLLDNAIATGRHVTDFYAGGYLASEDDLPSAPTGGYPECLADFMGTSQDAFSNVNGSSSVWTYNAPSATKLTVAAIYGAGADYYNNSQMYGVYEYLRYRGYQNADPTTVTGIYNQRIDSGTQAVAGGFSFAEYKAEIDADRPVMLHVEGHTMLGVGYDDTTTDTIILQDTWVPGTNTMTWGGAYSGMDQFAVTVVQLDGVGAVDSVKGGSCEMAYDNDGFSAVGSVAGLDGSAVATTMDVDNFDGGADGWATLKFFYSDEELATAGIADESELQMYWLDDSTWTFDGTGDAILGAPSGGLGAFGVDVDENYAWINVDHASTWTIAAVPEPATMILLGLGSTMLLKRRKRAA
jgi:hypothetical protein